MTSTAMCAAALALLLGASPVQAAGDIVWRVHCRFPNGKEASLEEAFDSSRECHDFMTGVSLSAETRCKAGDAKACAAQRNAESCSCRPERVP
jgi:hypothetical protein